MSLKLIDGPDTGTYNPVTIVADDSESMKTLMEAYSRLHPLDSRLSAVDSNMRAALAEHGYKEWPIVRPGPTIRGKQYSNRGPTKDSPPIVHDANRAMHLLGSLRRLLDQCAPAEDVAANALSLGVMCERVFIRPFEKHAGRGRKVVAAAAVGHTAVHGTVDHKRKR